MVIRHEVSADQYAIEQIHASAFRGHRAHPPGAEPVEHLIVKRLRADGALALSLVAEYDAKAVGGLALSPAVVGKELSGWFLLGPVGVLPQFQGQGIGSALVREALRWAREQGATGEPGATSARGIVLVGDPGFYTRFGFGRAPGLVYPGVPDQFVLAVWFGSAAPAGPILAHAAFRMTATGEE